MVPFRVFIAREIFSSAQMCFRFLARAEVRLKSLFIPILFALLTAAFEGLTFALLIPAIKKVIENSNTTTSLLPYILAVFLFAVGKSLSQYVASISLLWQMRKVADALRCKIYARYLTFGKQYFDANSAGELFQRLMGYTQELSLMLNSLHQALFRFFILISYCAVLVWVSWKLFFAVCLVFPVLYCAIDKLIRRIKATSVEYNGAYSAISKRIADSLRNMVLIKTGASPKQELLRFSSLSQSLRDIQYKMDKSRCAVSPVQETIMLVMGIFLVGAVAYFEGFNSSSELAKYLVFFVVLRRAMGTIGFFGDLQGACAQVYGPVQELALIFDDQNKFIFDAGTDSFEGLQKELCFESVSFCYSGGKRALSEVSLKITKGEVVGVIGASGAGKSTLINLLMKLYTPSEGQILIDGRELSTISNESWCNQVAYVSQEMFIFHDSLRENLCYGLSRTVSDNECVFALTQAGLGNYLESLPQGLKTVLGESGARLSGGEKQRLSIARALLRKADIVIMDEATSALDRETDLYVQDMISTTLRGKTIIVVAHKLSVIANADRVVILEDGRVARICDCANGIDRHEVLGRYLV